MEIFTAPNLAYSRVLGQRDADAVPRLERAIEQARTKRVITGLARWVVWLGEALLVVGRIAEAFWPAQAEARMRELA